VSHSRPYSQQPDLIKAKEPFVHEKNQHYWRSRRLLRLGMPCKADFLAPTIQPSRNKRDPPMRITGNHNRHILSYSHTHWLYLPPTLNLLQLFLGKWRLLPLQLCCEVGVEDENCVGIVSGYEVVFVLLEGGYWGIVAFMEFELIVWEVPESEVTIV